MKRFLLVALMPLLLCGATLTPIGADLKNGSGGVLLDGTWYSREAAPLDDGSVLFVARNDKTGYTNYTAVFKNTGGENEILRPGYIAFPFKNDPNDNWNVFPIGRNGLYGTISCWIKSEMNKTWQAALFVGTIPENETIVERSFLSGELHDEKELAVMRLATSGDGKTVMAQLSMHEMNVFRQGKDGKWTCTAKDIDIFTAELFRGIALSYDGTRLWHFTHTDKGSWLSFTDTATDGTETTVPVTQVDDVTQHSYYVACADNGKVVYFTRYLNGVAMLVKGIYDDADGSFRTQMVSLGTNGTAADGDSHTPVCSADGRFVAFASKATNLTADAVDGVNWQIFVYDSLRNELKLMSELDGAVANAICETPAISANGRYVTFTSAATNLGVSDGTFPLLYRAEIETTETDYEIVATIPENKEITRVVTTSEGTQVLFSTNAPLTILDNASMHSVYEHDMAAGVTSLVSPNDSGNYEQFAVSGDGRCVVVVPWKGGNDEWPGLAAYSQSSHIRWLELDFTGRTLAYIDSNGRLVRQEKGKEPVVLATDAMKVMGAVTVVRLSHNGQVLLYTAQNGLKAWFAETGEFVTLTNEMPRHVHLSQSGRYAFYRQSDYKLYRQETRGGEAEVIVEAGGIFAVSRDGRYAFHGTLEDTTLVRQELFGEMTEIEVGDSDGTGYATIAAATDGGRVYYLSGSTQLVCNTLTTMDEGPITVSGTCVEEIMENTGDDPAYEIALESSGNADYALRLAGETSAQGGTVSLLYPNGTRPWYALSYTPKKYFCGNDTVHVELWNGREWMAANVAITVENVNNPPEWTVESLVLNVNEGEISSMLEIGDFIIDYDFDYVGITEEVIELVVEGPKKGVLLLDGSKLKADLTNRYDIVTRDGAVLEYTITATDKAGEKAVVSLQVNITNTDLPPTLAAVGEIVYEGLPIEWSWFNMDDPDAEDTEDNLRLCFQSRHAEFYGNDGKKLNAEDGVYKSQFPITYRSTCNIQQDTLSVWAKDLDGLTSDPVTMAVEAAYIETSLADLYGGYDDEGHFGWNGVKRGWNLLSVPCDIQEEDMASYKAMMGLDVIWRWNGKCFDLAMSLNSDEGFWGYISILPEKPEGTLAGRRAFTTLRKGWNLRGAYGASLGGTVWMYENAVYVRKSEPVQGLGHWIFTK